MGILDMFSGMTPEQNQGLLGMAAGILQASGPSARPVGFGQVLGAGIQGLQQGQAAAREQQMQALQAKLFGIKLQDAESDLKNQDAARARAERIAKRLAGGQASGGMNPEGLTPASHMNGSDFAAAAASAGLPGDMGTLNSIVGLVNQGQSPAQAALTIAGPSVGLPQAGGAPQGNQTEAYVQRMMAVAQAHAEEGDVDGANKIYEQLLKFRPKYSNDITWLNGPDGKPVGVRFADDGNKQILDGFKPRDKAELVNLGGTSVAINPFDLPIGKTFQRTMTPGEAASSQLGWANNAIARGQLGIAGERLKIDKQEAASRAAVGKAPTEFQGKSAAFGLRATEADKIISSLEGKYSPASINAKAAIGKLPLIGGMLEAGTNLGMSDAEQRAEQAQRDFVNAVLRQESGAAIGAEEFSNARKQYFPQPGDGKAVIAQKARNRALAIQGLQSNAGRAALTAPPGAQPAAAGGVKFLGFE